MLIVSVAEFKEWSEYDTIKAMTDKRLEEALTLAQIRLGVYLCDPELDQVTGEVPMGIEYAIKRLAEAYAFDSSADSKSLMGFVSESMGNYSYSRGSVESLLGRIFTTLTPILQPYSKCEIPSNALNKVRMRRL